MQPVKTATFSAARSGSSHYEVMQLLCRIVCVCVYVWMGGGRGCLSVIFVYVRV